MRDTISSQQAQADLFEAYGAETVEALALAGWVLDDTTGQPDRGQAELFLNVLDPSTDRFTFQTFDDVIARRKERERKLSETNKKRKAKGLKPLKLRDPLRTSFTARSTSAGKGCASLIPRAPEFLSASTRPISRDAATRTSPGCGHGSSTSMARPSSRCCSMIHRRAS